VWHPLGIAWIQTPFQNPFVSCHEHVSRARANAGQSRKSMENGEPLWERLPSRMNLLQAGLPFLHLVGAPLSPYVRPSGESPAGAPRNSAALKGSMEVSRTP